MAGWDPVLAGVWEAVLKVWPSIRVCSVLAIDVRWGRRRSNSRASSLDRGVLARTCLPRSTTSFRSQEGASRESQVDRMR